MKTILFKRGKTGKTALRMRKQLNCYSSRSIERGRLSPSRITKAIRWGTTDYPEIHSLNTAEAVGLSSNKLKSLQVLKEKDISVPWFASKIEIADKDIPYPLVGRSTYHQGGSNFRVCEDHDAFDYDYKYGQSSHWLELIPVYKEYRVHVFGGEVIGISRKTDEGVSHRITNRYTRNHHSGWRFIRCDVNQIHDRLKELAISAVKALGLDFGAVDIILSTGEESTSSGGRKYYVLEVNSAPGMEPTSTIFQKYLQKFREY